MVVQSKMMDGVRFNRAAISRIRGGLWVAWTIRSQIIGRYRNIFIQHLCPRDNDRTLNRNNQFSQNDISLINITM